MVHLRVITEGKPGQHIDIAIVAVLEGGWQLPLRWNDEAVDCKTVNGMTEELCCRSFFKEDVPMQKQWKVAVYYTCNLSSWAASQ